MALLDRSLAAAADLQSALWPQAEVCRTEDELFDRDGIDAVILCTPTVEHFSQAMRSLDRGWHVLCEKPLAATRQHIIDLVSRADTAHAAGQAFSLGYQRRHLAIYRTLRREVRSARWGAVRAIVSHNAENWQATIPGTWRDDPRQNDGGFITDAGSHKLDSLFYVTGLQPCEVYARCQRWGSQVEIVASASALLSDGVAATISFVGHAQRLSEELHVHCEQADLLIRDEQLWIAQNGRQERLAVDEPESSPVVGLLETILRNAPEISPPVAALPVYDLTQAILKSGRLRVPVVVDQSQTGATNAVPARESADREPADRTG